MEEGKKQKREEKGGKAVHRASKRTKGMKEERRRKE